MERLWMELGAMSSKERPMTCPYRRCDGHVDVWAEGTDVDGATIVFGQCGQCGRVVEDKGDPPLPGSQLGLFP